MRYVPVIITVLFLFGGFSEAVAQTYCGERKVMVDSLSRDYKESRKSLGLLTGNMGVLEVFVSDTGEFSILVSLPNGKTCLMATGSNWENTPAKKIGLKS